MLPIHDDNPSSTRPVVTYMLIALNLMAFVFELSLSDTALARFFDLYAVVPRELIAATHGQGGADEFLALFTNIFLHGGWLHLGGNMLFLYIFGDNVEDRFGHASYLAFYLVAGALASLAHVASGPASSLPSLGASGAIGGVLGAYIVLHPAARVTTLFMVGIIFSRAIPAYMFLGVWFLMQSVQGFATLGAASTAETGGTAWFAHIGGFLFGVLAGFVGRLLPPPSAQHAARWYSNRR